MRRREIAALALLALIGLAPTLRMWAQGDVGHHPLLPLIMVLAYAGLAAPLLFLIAVALLAPSAMRLWRAHRFALVLLLLLLLVPVPAVKRHFNDAAGPENPRGYFPGEPAWLLLGVGLATGGRVGPLAAFEYDETILDGAWSLAPLVWVILFAAMLTWKHR
ncbi:MAG TPA: hypothetical protein VM370_10615 [Candidatus Thermoplasmatota archaeon]|nr:hypothetical protein [Candidatus Thermoplasmatota archaeon]